MKTDEELQALLKERDEYEPELVAALQTIPTWKLNAWERQFVHDLPIVPKARNCLPRCILSPKQFKHAERIARRCGV